MLWFPAPISPFHMFGMFGAVPVVAREVHQSAICVIDSGSAQAHARTQQLGYMIYIQQLIAELERLSRLDDRLSDGH